MPGRAVATGGRRWRLCAETVLIEVEASREVRLSNTATISRARPSRDVGLDPEVLISRRVTP